MAPRPAKQAPQETPALELVGVVEDPKPQALVAPTATPTPATLLAMAVQQGADLDKLERLMALQERWEANEARKAFVEAMVAFKAEDLTIGKNKHVSFKNRAGDKTEYDHAELSDVVGVIVPALARHGISHSWTFRQDSSGVTVGCVLTHRLGHRSDPVEMSAAPDDSGGKNKIQQIASTKTYLERYTLLAATGLATGGVALPGPSDDDDARAAGGSESQERGFADETRNARPNYGAWELQSEESRAYLQKKAEIAKQHLATGDVEGAVDFLQSQNLDSDESIAIWTRFDSAERAAMKKFNKTRPNARTEPGLTDGDREALERIPK